MEVQGKKVLITGASSGIGSALARTFAAHGAAVAVAARNVERLEGLANEIAGAGYARPAVLVADLSMPGGGELLATRALEALGSIDILINNAAVEGIGSYSEAGDEVSSRNLFETNYWSPMALIRSLLPPMRSAASGAIVNVSSLGAITPILGTGHYPSSKAALAIATETLRTELRGSGVHVLLVYPGFVDTPMLRDFKARNDLSATTRRSLRLMPVGRPEALARLVIRALRRRRKTLVYPRPYAVTPLVPAVSRWFTNLLFAPSRCCGKTSPRAMRQASTGASAA